MKTVQQPEFVSQQTIVRHNGTFFNQWERQHNSKAATVVFCLGVGQNKNAGQLLVLAADGVGMPYLITTLRSVADQMEKELGEKARQDLSKVAKRLKWHQRLWHKIRGTEPKIEETKAQGTEPGSKVVDMEKQKIQN